MSLYWGRNAISAHYGDVDNVDKCVDKLWMECGKTIIHQNRTNVLIIVGIPLISVIRRKWRIFLHGIPGAFSTVKAHKQGENGRSTSTHTSPANPPTIRL